MNKRVAALGDQLQRECRRAREFINELNLVSHPVSAAIADLTDTAQRLLALLGTDSTNSHLPPSQDPYREKKSHAAERRKPGGQPGHAGTRLVPCESPDRIVNLDVAKELLPPGAEMIGVKKAQVVEVESRQVVIEYRSPVYRLPDGSEIAAEFPAGVTTDIQYGQSVKALATYCSAYQLMPYRRIENIFRHQLGVPVCEGSIYNFLREAYSRLEDFDDWLKQALVAEPLLHADETGININGKTHWIHTLATSTLTLLEPHAKRGKTAMDDIGVLQRYAGHVCHDCWSSYFAYADVTHVLCNAHIMRELKGSEEKYGCRWARRMHALLKAMFMAWKDSGALVPLDVRKKLRKRYRTILTQGEKECGLTRDGGKIKRTKPQNLLIRLRDHEEAVLRFLDDPHIPFTNNLAENALRMAKVQQKISGCFRTMEGARFFCRIRSYLSTCLKNGVSPAEALGLLFEGKLPDFVTPVAAPNSAGE